MKSMESKRGYIQEQNNKSSDETNISKLLKDKPISEIVELMNIGERYIPIYPP